MPKRNCNASCKWWVFEWYWCHRIVETRSFLWKLMIKMYDTIARTQPFTAEMLAQDWEASRSPIFKWIVSLLKCFPTSNIDAAAASSRFSENVLLIFSINPFFAVFKRKGYWHRFNIVYASIGKMDSSTFELLNQTATNGKIRKGKTHLKRAEAVN